MEPAGAERHRRVARRVSSLARANQTPYNCEAMNPDKLFDYLDGRLTSSERAALEERLRIVTRPNGLPSTRKSAFRFSLAAYRSAICRTTPRKIGRCKMIRSATQTVIPIITRRQSPRRRAFD